MAKILVVDDQPMILRCLESALKSDGHDIVTVTAADTALRIAGFTTFDIIITDVIMPEMNGPEFIEKIMKIHPEIKVLFVSGYSENYISQKGILNGDMNFLQKPYSATTLGRKVKDVKLNGKHYVISVRDLKAGMYFVKIESVKGSCTKRFEKID